MGSWAEELNLQLCLFCLPEVCVAPHTEPLKYVDCARLRGRTHVADTGAVRQSTADRLLPASEGLIIIPATPPVYKALLCPTLHLGHTIAHTGSTRGL